jgi:carboxypeptidase C (cathepsin A)
MFPHLQLNDFYIISGSYGGKIVPSIAHQIHKHNKRKCRRDPYPRINLKGFLLASGFTDPISQIDYGDFYYSYGIIDASQRDYFRERESLAKANINQGNWSAAFEVKKIIKKNTFLTF